jgi:hypothetical protein
MTDGNVYVIDAKTREIVKSLQLAPTLVHQLKVSPDGATAVASIISTRTVTKIAVDEANRSWSVAQSLDIGAATGKAPICTVFRDDSRRAFVSLNPSGIAVVDVPTMTYLSEIPTDGFVACGMIKMYADEVIVFDMTPTSVTKVAAIKFDQVPGLGNNQPDAFGGGETVYGTSVLVGLRASGKHTVIIGAALIAVLTGLAACDDAVLQPTPTLPRHPPGQPPTDFPAVPDSAFVFLRVSPSFVPGSSRYVLANDTAFSLQYLTTERFFEYRGRYSRAAATLTFHFNDSAGAWEATGTLRGDSLIVRYNLLMLLADFEDGVYVAPPAR